MTKPKDDFIKSCKRILKYPETWDTMAYQTLNDAIIETISWNKASKEITQQQTAEEIFKDLDKIGIEEYDCEFEEYNKIKQKYLKEVLK